MEERLEIESEVNAQFSVKGPSVIQFIPLSEKMH